MDGPMERGEDRGRCPVSKGTDGRGGGAQRDYRKGTFQSNF